MLKSIGRVSCWALIGGPLFSVGCVPYQTYKQVVNELERTKESNADLVKKYNSAMLALRDKDKQGGVPSGDYETVLAENKRLKDQLSSAKKSINPGFPEEKIAELGARSEEGGIALGDALLFAEGSNKLRPEGSRVLESIATMLKQDYADEVIVIEGHTDNQPLDKTLGLWKYNMELAYQRAKTVFEYFLNHGVPESKLVVRAYSFNKPLNPKLASTKEGRRDNRRVVVRRGGTEI